VRWLALELSTPRLKYAEISYGAIMIIGIHTLFYSSAPEEARAFLREVLGLPHIDVGGGWLIFGAPPGELAIHPTGAESDEEKAPLAAAGVYLMCSDIQATIRELRAKGIEITKDVTAERWGLLSALRIPGGGEIGLYEPRHPTALSMSRNSSSSSKPRKGSKRATSARKGSAKGGTKKRK
jgi:catechol 2,3-dioxygenase-like lactoylglutathione lyase family enzyme